MNSLEKGNLFEDNVKELLRFQGNIVFNEKLLGHKKIDIYFEKMSFKKKERYAVECKNYSSKFSKNDLLVVVADYSALFDSNEIDKLLIVTMKGLSPSAEEYINTKNNIAHITFSELLNSIIDFSIYINNIISTYENSYDGINEYFIELNTKEYTLVETMWSNDFLKKNKTPFLNDFDTENNSLKKIITSWIDSSDSTPISILGSYGQGKTSFAKNLTYFLAKNFLSDVNSRIPIYIKLSSISKEQSIEGLLGKELASSNQIVNYNYASFQQLNLIGKLVIILDGFDEMKHSLSWDEFRYNFSELNKLIVNNSKVILLGRPNAFINDGEHTYILRGGIKNTSFGITRDPNWPEYHELTIAPLENFQIKDFMQLYYNYLIKKAIDIKLKRKYINAKENKSNSLTNKRLKDISNRPVQLKMLADLLPSIQNDIGSITITLLYHEFIDLILGREYEKESRVNIDKADRRKFSRKIAIYLWENSNEYSIKLEDIPETIFTEFILSGLKDADKIKRDYISGCFLSRKLGDSIYFPHKSFQEFFVSEEILYRVRDNKISFEWGKKDLLNWINSNLTKEVTDFFIELLSKQDLDKIDILLNSYNGNLRKNFVNIYQKNEFQSYVEEKLKSSKSTWYYIFQLNNCINGNSNPLNLRIALEGNISLKSYISSDDIKLLFLTLFIGANKKINSVADLLFKLSISYNFFYKNSYSSDALKVGGNFIRISEIFSKINISKKNKTVDLRGLSQIFLRELVDWCFIEEWGVGKIIDKNEYDLIESFSIDEHNIELINYLEISCKITNDIIEKSKKEFNL